MDLGHAIAQWIMDLASGSGALGIVPAGLLRQSLDTQAMARLVGLIFGEREAEELHALLERPPRSAERRPTVLLPGLMGSLLASVCGISTTLWFNPRLLADGQLNLLDLNSSGTGDRVPDVEIEPVGIEKLSYLRLILTLARESRLYEFPYDWRRHLEWNAKRLRSALERWASASPGRRFTLVGHSMGGLLARAYLALYPEEARQTVERVVMVGTPLWGAVEAVLLLAGESAPAKLIERIHPDNDVQHLVRNMPSLYQILPPPRELYAADRAYPADWDLYDAAAWRLPGIRQDYLDDGRRLWQALATLSPDERRVNGDEGTPVEMIEIAGCNQRTLTDVWQALNDDEHDAAPQFMLVHQEAGDDAGDDTVPLWSTRAPGVQTYYVEEHHQALCSNEQVLDGILDLIGEEPLQLPSAPPAPRGVIKRLRTTPVAQQAAQLRERFANGDFTREDLLRLFFPN
ncbi:MAG: alpha/beta fold hydrolase [Anaerolineae bacterium]|nr:alpha/beta fold hydrolase [Anaerolineae bacterium]